MKYADIKTELNCLEVNDLESALRKELLKRLESLLENRKNTHKVDFTYQEDLNKAVDEIGYRLNKVFDEYEKFDIEIHRFKEKTKSNER